MKDVKNLYLFHIFVCYFRPWFQHTVPSLHMHFCQDMGFLPSVGLHLHCYTGQEMDHHYLMASQKSIITTGKKDGKFLYPFHSPANLFRFQFLHVTPHCKDLRQFAKICGHVNMINQAIATWNWHAEISMT